MSYEYQDVLMVLTIKHASCDSRCFMSSDMLSTEFANESVVGVYLVK